ncbi:N-alpha-acetyltransferase 20 [Drosophila mojavensis]|uniref:N-alpha-acetyltransferase 20 n=1 Tax=Drosophila mojavensis TaxID=7230 RepID=B4KH80_DROMO|nr:N-alpha-acetyltransferase 20 [Drosophila mojavensis]EDW13297.1 uncharacterized protein Dmoj_GI20771 [Drosophila mojavensis]
MTALREFAFDDLFKFNRMLFDPLTEVYSNAFYAFRLLEFPMLNEVAVAPNGQLTGFIMGVRVRNERWVGNGKDPEKMSSHGHVSALAIDNDFRRLGVGTLLMESFRVKLEVKREWYIDLFVRCKNQNAIKFYELLGYAKYSLLPRYYHDDDGYEMRLPLSQDVDGTCLKGRMNAIDGLYSAGRELVKVLKMLFGMLRDAILNVL